MKIPRLSHNWRVSVLEAIAVQHTLAGKVTVTKPDQPPRFICGIDAAFSRDGKYCLAGAVLWDMQEQKVVEQHTAASEIFFPYIPGLLTFREGPAVIRVLRKLRRKPDVLLFDGQGIAHPRGLGIAAHIGVVVGMSAIGCAKSRLVGSYMDPDPEKGSQAVLYYKDKIVGTVLRTRTNVKPVFVSVGHLIDLETAVRVVLGCAVKYRLPEPTRLADQLVGKTKKNGRLDD